MYNTEELEQRALAALVERAFAGKYTIKEVERLLSGIERLDGCPSTFDLNMVNTEARSLGFEGVGEALDFIAGLTPITITEPSPFSPEAKGYVGTYLGNISALKEVFRTKNADYGHAVLITYYLFGTEGGLLPRLWDKLLRCTSINAKGVTLVEEKLSETLSDMANYALIAQAVIETYPDRDAPELKEAFMQAMSVMKTGKEVANIATNINE